MSETLLRLALILLLMPAVQSIGPPVTAAAAEQHDPQEAGEAPETQQTYGNTPAELVPYARSEEPYRRFYVEPPAFRGPGRDEPEPRGLGSVRIGLIAPLEGAAEDQAGPDMQRGVLMALEEANASGGYDDLPFELVTKNDQALWGSSSNTLVELAYEDRVWALIGSIDSNTTHVALRAALKAELMIVNVGSTDPTMTETGIPWIVRITPDDRQTSYRLARRVFEERGLSRVAILRSNDRYGRFGVKEFRDAARRLARPVPLEIQFHPGAQDFSAQLERLEAAGVEAVVLWASASDGGRIVRQLRDRGMTQPVLGTDRLVDEEFLRIAGPAADGVETTGWFHPQRSDPDWIAFRDRFRARFGTDAGPYAAYAYDATNLVVEAVRRQGLNRARIRDELMELRSYRGVTGEVRLDSTSNSVAPLVIARVEGGRFVYP